MSGPKKRQQLLASTIWLASALHRFVADARKAAACTGAWPRCVTHHFSAYPGRSRHKPPPAPGHSIIAKRAQDKVAQNCVCCAGQLLGIKPAGRGARGSNERSTVNCAVARPFAALPRLHHLHPHEKAKQQPTKEMLWGSTPGNPRALRRHLPRTLQFMLPMTADYIEIRGGVREFTAGRAAAAPQRGADALSEEGVQEIFPTKSFPFLDCK